MMMLIMGSSARPRLTRSLATTTRLIFFFITLGLKSSETKVLEPHIRALPGTDSHYCEPVVLGTQVHATQPKLHFIIENILILA